MLKCCSTELRRIIGLLFLIVLANARALYSQSNSGSDSLSAEIDMLLPPASPAFTILGLQPTSVERPGTPTDLKLTVLNALSGFGSLPKDFAVEIAPAWILGGSGITYGSFASDQNVGNNIWQTLSISAATATKQPEGDVSVTSAGIGVRFSILRGAVDEDFENLRAELAVLNREVHTAMVTEQRADPVLRELDSLFRALPAGLREELIPVIERRKTQRIAELQEVAVARIHDARRAQLERIQQLASSVRFTRRGFKLEMAGGLTGDFIDGVAENGKLRKYGLWMLGAYEMKQKSVLGVLRVVGDATVAQSTSIELGARGIYMNDRKLAMSFETVVRKFPNTSLKAQWRYAGILEYGVAHNTILTITLGKDFQSQLKSSLLALLNLSLGLGSMRPIL